MDGVERILLVGCVDFATRSKFFLLFLNGVYFCYRKIFPNNVIEFKLSCFFPFFYLINFDPRILAGLIFFSVSTGLKSLGEIESSMIASIFSGMSLHRSLSPVILNHFHLILITSLTLSSSSFHSRLKLIWMILNYFLILSYCEDLPSFIQSNLFYLFYWSAISIFFISIITLANYYSFSSMIQRKLFHLMLLLIFIPGLAVKEFLSFAFLSALYFLTILEKLRQSIQILNNFFLKFIDERDSSDLIVTHLYLLLGFGFPVIFSVLFNNDLISWSGIISLGIGDTFACLSGVTLGRHRLPYRRKTLEGTLGGYISMILSLSFFYPISPSLGTCLFLVSFYEAFTLKIDNLVLPIFSIALFSCL